MYFVHSCRVVALAVVLVLVIVAVWWSPLTLLTYHLARQAIFAVICSYFVASCH